MTTLAEQVAQWVLDFDPASIPASVLEKAKLHVLDSLGCAFGALQEGAPQGVLRAVAAMGGTPECTVIGLPQRTSAANAVLANGMLVRHLDLNDSAQEWGGAGHPSDNISVALAMGERQGSSGREVLGAVVLGYELYLRSPSSARPWDGSTHSSLVAAAIAGTLLHLPLEQLANAITLSVAHSNTLSIVRRGQLSAAKSLANPMVGRHAVTATLLAAEGVTGPPTALEEWSEAVFRGADLRMLMGLDPQAKAPAPEGEWRTPYVGLKAHPAIGTAQCALTAALRVREQLKDPLGEIERIEVHMADIPFVRGQVADTERRHPTTRESADHSFPFLVAVALLDGELTLRQFQDGRWFDPAVRTLIDRMVIAVDAGLNKYLPGGFPASVRVRTRSRTDIFEEVPYHPGHPRNPMTIKQVEAKFHRFSAGSVPEERRMAIIEAVHHFDEAASIRPLMSLVQ